MPPDTASENQLLTARDLERTLDRMAQQVLEPVPPNADPASTLALVGMQTRGVHLARRLQRRLQEQEDVDLPMGVLDVTMYRDDVRFRLEQRRIQETRIPFDVTDRHLVLVDDVVYTGRTGRAALDALMDLGRPASVRFLVVIDRGHRELPIAPDIVGREVSTLSDEAVRVGVTEVDDADGVWLVDAPSNGENAGDAPR